MLSSIGLFWSSEDASLTLQPCDEPQFIKEPEVGYFYIQVENTFEHKHIRLDKWNTPVLSDVQSSCIKFETMQMAINFIEQFNLCSTGHLVKVRYARATGNYVWDDIVRATCILKKDNKGKFSVDVTERK